MATKNNSDKDNNTLTNFQPIPRRFIAWDKHQNSWVAKFLMPSTDDKESDNYTYPLTLGIDSKGEKNWLNNDHLIICQSTNLFDKDGKEIFEGSIISSHSGDLVGVVKQHKSGEWRIWWGNIENGSTVLSEPNVYPLTLVGHILSNPELLEER